MSEAAAISAATTSEQRITSWVEVVVENNGEGLIEWTCDYSTSEVITRRRPQVRWNEGKIGRKVTAAEVKILWACYNLNKYCHLHPNDLKVDFDLDVTDATDGGQIPLHELRFFKYFVYTLAVELEAMLMVDIQTGSRISDLLKIQFNLSDKITPACDLAFHPLIQKYKAWSARQYLHAQNKLQQRQNRNRPSDATGGKPSTTAT